MHTFGKLVSGDVALHVVHVPGAEAVVVTEQWRNMKNAIMPWWCDRVSFLLRPVSGSCHAQIGPVHGRSFLAGLRCVVR